MKMDLNLDSAQAPEDVARILRNAADQFRCDAEELQTCWQDIGPKKTWCRIAAILERAAASIERRCHI